MLAVLAEPRGATRAHQLHEIELLVEPFPESPWPTIGGHPKLLHQAEFTKEGNSLFSFGDEAAVGKPSEEIERRRRAR